MRKTIYYVLLFSLILTAAACASKSGKIKGSSLASISVGMPKEQVVQILGKPQSVNMTPDVEVYRYWEDQGYYILVYHDIIFASGKVVRVVTVPRR